jgi:HEPN domain-containing protein
MSAKADVARGWLRKARSDELALDASLSAGAFDAACFHAQQAAEKYLKAFLIHAGSQFPRTHNLAKLAALCADAEASFRSLIQVVEPLTPYAVEMRYDHEFWPSREVAEEARSSARKVGEFVLRKLPREIAEEGH